MTTITLPVNVLTAVSLFASKNDVRYYLNGVYIENGRITGTDGHCLLTVPCEFVECETPMIIPNDAIKAMLKVAKAVKDDLIIINTIADDNEGFRYNGVFFTPIDGRFPDYKRLLVKPDDVTGETSQYDPELLVRYKKATKALAPKSKNTSGFVLHHNGDGAGVVTFTSGYTEALGVVMPWRV